VPERQWVPALLGTALSEGRVRCDLCPHRCRLDPGAAGACAVRRNTGGTLMTSSFTVSVAHVDPIERKPFYHAWPGSNVLTVAAPGCTFRCDYCLNSNLSQYGRLPAVRWKGAPADVPELLTRASAESAGIAFSYTEPALMIELTMALDRARSGSSPRLFWKTNGFLTGSALRLVAPVLAAVNVDVKTADNDSHLRLTGAPLDPVFETIAGFRRAGVWVEASTPLIPGMSDTPEHWRRIAGRLAAIDPDIPWHLLRFTPDFRMSRSAPTSPTALAEAAKVARDNGLRYVYVERALGEQGRDTRCTGCDEVVVRRGIWSTASVHLRAGACPACGTAVAGCWE
jgi:pyruvate formate lyase activating enzyme